MNTNKLTGIDTTGLTVDPVKEDAERGEAIIDALIGPRLSPIERKMVVVSTPKMTGPKAAIDSAAWSLVDAVMRRRNKYRITMNLDNPIGDGDQ